MVREQEQQAENENYWQNEISSRNIQPKQKNELNDKKGLEGLATAIKEFIFRITSLPMVAIQKLTNRT
jgi:hypothetical protein